MGTPSLLRLTGPALRGVLGVLGCLLILNALSVRAAETLYSVTILQPLTGKHALRHMARNVLESLGRYLTNCKVGLLQAAITVTPEGPVSPEPTTATSPSHALDR
jgi:hypothetical protein